MAKLNVFEQIKAMAFGRITIEELHPSLVTLLGEATGDQITALQAAIGALEGQLGTDKAELEKAIADAILASEGKIQVLIDALDARITVLEGKMTAAEGKITALEAADVTLQGNIDAVDSKVDAHIVAYGQKVSALEAEDVRLQGEIDNVKSLVGNKNSNTQVFETFEAFNAGVTAEGVEPKVGDLAFVLDIKKAYIYKGVDAGAAVLVLPEPPAGWVYFDEISTEIDLADFAKISYVDGKFTAASEALASEVAKLNGEITRVEGLVTAEVTRAKAEEARIEGKVDANTGAIEAEVARAKGVEAGLQSAIDALEAQVGEDLQGAIAGVQAALDQEVIDRTAADTVLDGKITTEKERAIAEEGKLAQAIADEVTARTEADAQVLVDAKAYTDAEIVKINTASGELAGRVTTLEGEMDQAQADILAQAAEIAALEARRFILTRSQDVVTTDGSIETLHPLATLKTLPNNVLVDVHVNSVLMHSDDYVLDRVGGTIKFLKPYAEGKKVAVVYTYNYMLPEVGAEGPVVGQAKVGEDIVG